MGIKIHDVAYVRFSAPGLDAMEAFLTDFGLVRAGQPTTRFTRTASKKIRFCTRLTQLSKLGYAFTLCFAVRKATILMSQ
jgi:hypothetical protein